MPGLLLTHSLVPRPSLSPKILSSARYPSLNAKHPRTASFMLTYKIIAFMYISRNGNVKSKDLNIFAT